MSALNDAVGDGRYISIPDRNILTTRTEEELLKMTPEEISTAQKDLNEQAAMQCANIVAGRYKGIRSLGTTIHSSVPSKEPSDSFFFDEEYIKKWHDTKSKHKKTSLPGSCYYKNLSDIFEEQYIKYDNGVEGRRRDGKFFHENIERIPPPVPDYQREGWHYHNLNSLPEEYRNVEEREVNDFCPRSQLKKYVDSFGDIEVVQTPGSSDVHDENDVYNKIMSGIPEFIDKYVGPQQAVAARKEAEKIYLRKLKSASKRSQNAERLLESKQYQSVVTGNLKIKIAQQRVPSPLLWNGWQDQIEMTNTCTADNMLYATHCLLQERCDLADAFKINDNETLKLLYDVHNTFKDNKPTLAKFKWLSQFFDRSLDQWDCYGSEWNFSFGKLPVTNAYTSQCTHAQCPQPVVLYTSQMVGYVNNQTSLSSGVMKWWKNKETSLCGRNACSGIRKNSARAFVCTPLLIPVEINGSSFKSCSPEIEVASEKYSLFMITYGNGGHFCSSVKISGQWWLYDGLKEYNRRGSGLQKQIRPIPPQGYRRNYALYFKNSFNR